MANVAERRAAPRFEIFAQASVASGGDIYLMAVRNISASGVFLDGKPKEHPDLQPGVAVEVTLSAATPGMSDDEVINIVCQGKVARVEIGTPARPGGFGITLDPATDAERERLEDLLSRLADIPPDQRSSNLG